MSIGGWIEDLRASSFGAWMHDALLTVFDVIGTPVLIYFVLINTSYLVLIAVATLDFARHLRRMPYSGLDEVASSPLTQPVSIVMAAHREEVGIIVAVRAMLALRYPEYELIVVVDGDPDPTLDVLAEEFDLVPCPFTVTTDVPVRVRPTHLFVPRDGRTALRVLVKQNSGRSDSLNVGINLARYPLVALVDADSVLDPDALLVVSKPFADDPQRTVATGGVIRALNGCQVLGGRAGWCRPRCRPAGSAASRWSSTCALSCSAAPGGPGSAACCSSAAPSGCSAATCWSR